MFDYFIKAILFQILFLAIYDLFLKKETFFQWNRWYLLGTSLLSYVIPLIRIESAAKVVPQEYVIALPEVVLNPSKAIEQQVQAPEQVFNYMEALYWTGIFVAFVIFSIKLIRLYRLLKNSGQLKMPGYVLVALENSTAFSFFKYVFLGKGISESNRQEIISHELIHVKQWHSLDLLFFELQKITCWFNPLSYIFQNRIADVHEFIADAQSVKTTDTATYFNKLLAETFGIQHLSFINPFFKHSLIKKRIIMLHKNRSKQLLKFKYLLLVPVLAGMLLYTSCEKSDGVDETLNKNERRLVKMYMKFPFDEEVKIIESKKQGYFDHYILDAVPEGEEITYDKLTDEEKADFDNLIERGENYRNNKFKSYIIFEMPDGKKALKEEIDWAAMKANWDSEDYTDADEVPFAVIDKAPVFPGCEDAEDQKKCFEEAIQNHIQQNFNTALINTLDLKPGKKRVYVQFEIKKDGGVTYVRARDPHEELEKEAQNVIYELPQMIPGEHNGKKVNVKYTVPITLIVSDNKEESTSSTKKLSYSKPRPVSTASKYDTSIPGRYVYGKIASRSKLLPGANVSVEGSNKKTVTDFDGNFKIKAKEGEILVFQFLESTSKLKVGNDNFYEISM